jgi:hypothetical protein
MRVKRWWLLLNQEESTIPTLPLSGKLRPFTVHPAHHRLVGWLGVVVCALLLIAAVLFAVLGLAQGKGDNVYFAAAVCGSLLLTLGWIIDRRIRDRLEVDGRGVHVTHGRRTKSISWDQLVSATVERVRNEVVAIPFVRRLVVYTRIRSVPSIYGLDTADDGRLPEIAAAIRKYRDRIGAGTAQWEPHEPRQPHPMRAARDMPPWLGLLLVVLSIGLQAFLIYGSLRWGWNLGLGGG